MLEDGHVVSEDLDERLRVADIYAGSLAVRHELLPVTLDGSFSGVSMILKFSAPSFVTMKNRPHGGGRNMRPHAPGPEDIERLRGRSALV